MNKTSICLCYQFGRSHHAGWQLCQDRRFEARDGVEAGMLPGTRCQINPSSPCLVKGISRRLDHAWEQFDPIELAERRRWQDDLNSGAEAFIIDWLGETARKANRQLFERHDLQAVLSIARRI